MVKKWNKSAVIGVGLGQLLSLLLTSSTFAYSQLANKGIIAPFSLSLLNYLLLAFIYGGIMLYQGKSFKLTRTLDRLNYYVGLGSCDVMANYLLIKVKQYKLTSLTSIMLIDCWKIPCVVLVTWFFLKTKYTFRKLVGVTICTAGFVTFIFSHIHSSDTSRGRRPITGDLFIIAGATYYGVGNAVEEFLIKKVDPVVTMASLGIFGAIITAYIIPTTERNELKSVYSFSPSPGTIFPLIGFCLAKILFYSGVPLVLKTSGSTMLTLSLLTSDMWVILIRFFVYHQKVDWTYFVAFAAVTLGLIVYSWGDKMDPNNGEEDIDSLKNVASRSIEQVIIEEA